MLAFVFVLSFLANIAVKPQIRDIVKEIIQNHFWMSCIPSGPDASQPAVDKKNSNKNTIRNKLFNNFLSCLFFIILPLFIVFDVKKKNKLL